RLAILPLDILPGEGIETGHVGRDTHRGQAGRLVDGQQVVVLEQDLQLPGSHRPLTRNSVPPTPACLQRTIVTANEQAHERRRTSMNSPALILASGSPQRQKLLTEAGYSFRIVVPRPHAECGVCSRETPGELVARLARQKAADVVDQLGVH